MSSKSGATVLVAEDNPVNQKVIGLLLDMLGVAADFVSDGRKAIEASVPDSYSLILMDIMMPEVDGFEAAYEIRKQEFRRGLHTPIIACTALDREKVIEECIRSGIDDYLGKPISSEALKDTIERWSSIPIKPRAANAETDSQYRRLSAYTDESDSVEPGTLKMLYRLEQVDDILVLFLTVTETLLAQLKSAIKDKDVSVVKRMAHEIKGSSVEVNAQEMAQLSLQLEEAADSVNFAAVEKLYTSLGWAFARVREFTNKKPSWNDLYKAS